MPSCRRFTFDFSFHQKEANFGQVAGMFMYCIFNGSNPQEICVAPLSYKPTLDWNGHIAVFPMYPAGVLRDLDSPLARSYRKWHVFSANAREKIAKARTCGLQFQAQENTSSSPICIDPIGQGQLR